MGFGEFKHHDIIVKVPGSVLTRYKLMSDFRQDFENPRISLSSTNGSPTDIRGTHYDDAWCSMGSQSSLWWFVDGL